WIDSFFIAEKKPGRGEDSHQGLGDALFEILAAFGVTRFGNLRQAMDDFRVCRTAKSFFTEAGQNFARVFAAFDGIGGWLVLEEEPIIVSGLHPIFRRERTFNLDGVDAEIN